MEFIPFSKIDKDEWDKFCLNHPMGWFWHTSYRVQHALNSSKFIQSINKSFVALNNKKIIAIAPLTIDYFKESSIKQMTYGGSGTPIPLVSLDFSKEKYATIYNKIFDEIDKIAKKNKVVRAEIIQPFTYPYKVKNNIALKYGYIDCSLSTQIIELTKSKADLFKDLQANHKRAINKGLQNLEIKIYNSKNIRPAIFNNYINFYKKKTGENTRPKKTFDLSYFYLKNNMALLGVAEYKGVPVGYVLTIYFKNIAYYLTGAKEDNFKICPISHIIHWEMMLFLKKQGINYYEIGIQQYGNLFFDNPSIKQINISKFKRGFGGKTIPRFGAEKFYDRSYAKKILKLRTKEFIENIDI